VAGREDGAVGRQGLPIDIPNLLPDEIEFAQAHHWGFETEDCLRLNVWTPSINDGRKRPVMVVAARGRLLGRSSIELPFYDGENLSRTGDVVVVSVNHRLNVLGFSTSRPTGRSTRCRATSASSIWWRHSSG